MGEGVDPWADNGELRILTTLIEALLPHATGIAIPNGPEWTVDQAQELFAKADGANPWPLWIETGLQRNCRYVASRGLLLHGLPDVVAQTIDPDEDRTPSSAAIVRACDAVLSACEQMVLANAALAHRDRLEVKHANGRVSRYWAEPFTRYFNSDNPPQNPFAVRLRPSAR